MDAEDPDTQAARMDGARRFIAALPHAVALDLRVEGVAPGMAEMSMPWSERIVGDPATGVIHGGAVSTLMDTSCGAAVLSHPEAGHGTATMDLRIDYMRGAVPGQRIVARAECMHVTRSVAFVRAEARDDDGLVAVGNGSFTVDRP